MADPFRIGVLASGEGSTLEGLVRGASRYRIALVVVDRPGAGAVEVAARHGIEVLDVGRPGDDARAWGDRMTRALEAHGVRLIVLAGFLSILPPSWTEQWKGRAINLHPSLLPRHGGPGMHGLRVHDAVIAAGDRESGATVHLVTNDVDRGPVLAQARIPVRPDDSPATLRERLRPVEVALLVRTIDEFASGERPLPASDAVRRPGEPAE